MKPLAHILLKRLLLINLFNLVSGPASAEIAPEPLGQVETMPSPRQRNIITVSDAQVPYAMEGRVHFIDADQGRYLGMLNTGYWYGGVVYNCSTAIVLGVK